jgi:hypothetical protein
MRLARTFLAAATALVIAYGAHAQTAIDLEPGQPRARPAAATRAPEFFRFLGEPGQTARIALTGSGPLEVQLYEPQGVSMREAKGDGNVTLEAILPRDGVFLVSVVRADPSKPYSVTLTRDTPDPYFAYVAEGVGYSIVDPGETEPTTSCWLEPGAKMRGNLPGGSKNVITLGRGGRVYFQQTSPRGQVTNFEAEMRFEGDDVVLSYKGLSRGPLEERAPVLDPKGTWTYKSYLCP